MALLRATKGLTLNKTFPIKPEGLILGRNPDADVVLDHDAVSRPHARIDRCDDAYYLEDLHSLNGTIVNGQPLAKGPEGRRRLRDDDRIKICGFHFVFEDDSTESPMVMMIDDAAVSPIHSTVQASTDSSDPRLQANPATKLKALVGITQDLANALRLDVVLPKVLDSLFRVFRQTQRGFVLLRDPQTGAFLRQYARWLDQEDSPIRISRRVVDEAISTRSAILTNDATQDERFQSSRSVHELQIHSMMCAPLLNPSGEPIGLIELDVTERKYKFTPEDLDVLVAVAQQVSIVVQNSRLHEDIVQKEVERAQLEHEHQLVLAKLELQHQLDKQRIETELANFARDLDLAREVQRRLLPTTPPTLPDYKFASRYEPAEQVGGDYYDYIYLPGHRLAVVVADASGDGIPAALLMASFAGEMRQLLVSQPRPEVAVARLNDALVRSVPEGRFVTLIAVVIDLSTHMVTIINGGHQPPLLRHPGGQVITLKAKELNYPLGWFPQIEFVPLTVSLEPGDQLLLFTDGVDGAMNAQQASYGVARVQAVLGACPEGAAAVVQQLFADVKSFVGDRRQNDDMCIVSVARVVR